MYNKSYITKEEFEEWKKAYDSLIKDYIMRMFNDYDSHIKSYIDDKIKNNWEEL